MPKPKTFLGQPRGLATLFFTEMWERFSYYGMRAILLFYMYFSVTDGGLGFDQATAASIMSIYGSLVYLASVLGGFVSDRILGSQRTVLIGGILIMIGHIVLATPFGKWALFISIALIILGTGLLKPNVSEMVGDLYAPGDTRRDAGFNIFVFGINVGAFVAPLVVGYLGQKVNFHLGFSLAAVGMFIGLVQYIIDGKKYFSPRSFKPQDPLTTVALQRLLKKVAIGVIIGICVIVGAFLFKLLNVNNIITILTIVAVMLPIYYFILMLRSKKTSKIERSQVRAYILLFIAAILFWSIEEQGAIVLALFAEDQVRLSLFGHTFPASWFQSMNPLFIMIYTPFFAYLWYKWGKKQPSAPTKFAFGLFFAGLSFLWMMLPGLLFGTNTKVSPGWLIISWALVIIGELLISPIGLSVTTKLAPRAFRSQMMSMWFLSDAVAQALNAQLVKFYSRSTEIQYFGIVGIMSIILGCLLLLLVPHIKKLMNGTN